jgi:hypothetical protein
MKEAKLTLKGKKIVERLFSLWLKERI